MLQHSSLRLFGLVSALALVAGGAPAFGQDFTVVGQTKTMHARTVTAAIHSSDLDLTTKDGRSILRQRIRKTAAELCHQVGADRAPPGLAFACEDAAVLEAAPLQRALIAQARAAPRSLPTSTQAANSFGVAASATPAR